MIRVIVWYADQVEIKTYIIIELLPNAKQASLDLAHVSNFFIKWELHAKYELLNAKESYKC